MAEKGLVTELKGELAIVKLTRQEACAKCRACIAGMTEQEMFIEAENACGATTGDWVFIDLRDNGFLHAVLIMYGLPLVGLLTGLLVGYYPLSEILGVAYGTRELLGFSCGIVCTLLVYLWIKMNDEKWENSKKYRPIAIGITEEDTKE